jgi:type I restriction enzyme, S subunit
LSRLNENRVGYKETKLGWIPYDWDVYPIEKTSKVIMGQSPGSENYNSNYNGLPFIQGNADIQNGKSSPRYWTTQVTKECRIGDVLLSVRAPVGEISISEHDACIGRGICALRYHYDNLFLYHYLKYFEPRWIRYSQGSTFEAITTKEIKKLLIPVPPIPEQKKIAEILNTWDKAIELVGKHIEYKQQLKKGLMQQLLSVKIRFPGLGKPGAEGEIPKGWRTEKLSDHFELVKRKNTKGINRVLTASGEYGLIDQIEFFNKTVAGKDLSGYYLLKEGEFAYNRSAMNGYPYGAIKRLDRYEEGAVSTLYICFSLKKGTKTNSDFYTYYFEAGCLNRQLKMVTQVGGRAHGLLNVTKSDFMSVQLLVPGLDEQNKIAKALKTLDKEIDFLKAQEVELKKQKQGLMQKLLTGAIRVQGRKSYE